MDIYDLESKITQIHNYVDILNDISYGILEAGLTPDETVNAIEGLAVMLKLHADKTFDVYKKAYRLDEYKNIL